MRKVTYKCDRCHEEIQDVVYTITCYAEDLCPGPVGGVSGEVVRQNCRQNVHLQMTKDRHLCSKCKDEITDGIFIV